MRKFIFLTLTIVMVAMTTVNASAQERRTEANHSVTINLTGRTTPTNCPLTAPQPSSAAWGQTSARRGTQRAAASGAPARPSPTATTGSSRRRWRSSRGGTTDSTGAQGFKKGDWFVGARSAGLGIDHLFGQSTVGNTSQTVTKLNLDGLGGWFFADRFAVDATAGLTYVRYGELPIMEMNGGGESYYNFVFGAGVRYYPVAGLFGRVGLGGAASDVDKFFELGVEARAGYDLFLGERVFFEPSVYYTKTFEGNNHLGLSVGFGVKF